MVKPCHVCGGEPETRETFFGYVIEHKTTTHDVAVWADTLEEAIDRWDSRPVWYVCGVCGNRNYIGTRCPVCGEDRY